MKELFFLVWKLLLLFKTNRFPKLLFVLLNNSFELVLNLLLETVRFGILRKRIPFHGEGGIASDGSAETKQRIALLGPNCHDPMRNTSYA